MVLGNVIPDHVLLNCETHNKTHKLRSSTKKKLCFRKESNLFFLFSIRETTILVKACGYHFDHGEQGSNELFKKNNVSLWDVYENPDLPET